MVITFIIPYSNIDYVVDVCVVLPTLNEAGNLRILLPSLSKSLAGYDWHIVVVDDGSMDGTQDVVLGFAKETGKAELIERGTRLGLSSAIKVGMQACVEKGASAVVVMDADLQHPPEVVPKLVDAVLNGFDIAIASRYIKGGGVYGWSLRRLLISKGATYLARLLLPWVRGIKDPVSGFFAINGDKVKQLLPYMSESSGYKLILELITLMNAQFSNLRIAEVPYVFKSRIYGKSKLSVHELWKYALLVIKLSNYSPIKYLVSLVVAALIGYLLFNFINLNIVLRNFISLESSLIVALTLYVFLMGLKVKFSYYAKYHLIKYGSVLLKIVLMPYLPAYLVLLIAAVFQLIMTLRVIPIAPHIIAH